MLQGAPNFRDLADATTGTRSRLRRGLIFRSELLSGLPMADRERLETLGIGLVCDLRSSAERAKSPSDIVPPSAAGWITAGEGPQHLPGADVVAMLKRIEQLEPGDADSLMLDTYRAMPQTLAPALRALLGRLALPSSTPTPTLDPPLTPTPGATLIHCTAGKDRTGFVCAVLLAALGVEWDAIARDYLATARFCDAERMLLRLEAVLGKRLDARARATAAGLVAVKPAYLQAAFEEIDRAEGSLDNYLHRRIGLDEQRRSALQSRLVEA